MTVKEQMEMVDTMLTLVKKFNESSGKRLEFDGQIGDMKIRLEKELLFGFDIGKENSGRDVEHIRFYGTGKCTITCEDDGKNPYNEYLYSVEFPTGPYFLSGSDAFYPKELFSKFFCELKSFNPAFIDSANKELFFRPDNAKAVHDALPCLIKKYKAQINDEFKKYRKDVLEAELKKLSETKE